MCEELKDKPHTTLRSLLSYFSCLRNKQQNFLSRREFLQWKISSSRYFPKKHGSLLLSFYSCDSAVLIPCSWDLPITSHHLVFVPPFCHQVSPDLVAALWHHQLPWATNWPKTKTHWESPSLWSPVVLRGQLIWRIWRRAIIPSPVSGKETSYFSSGQRSPVKPPSEMMSGILIFLPMFMQHFFFTKHALPSNTHCSLSSSVTGARNMWYVSLCVCVCVCRTQETDRAITLQWHIKPDPPAVGVKRFWWGGGVRVVLFTLLFCRWCPVWNNKVTHPVHLICFRCSQGHVNTPKAAHTHARTTIWGSWVTEILIVKSCIFLLQTLKTP